MKMYSIPDKNKVSKEEWEAYIERIASHVPTEQDRINYNLFNDSFNYGYEIVHVDGQGNSRRIHPMSDEAQQVFEKLYGNKS